MTTASKRERFRAWRRRRPFWGGLLLMLAGLELFLSANQTIGEMEVHVGPTGFLSYLLPALLLLCGLLVWFTPAQRLFYGIIGLLTALYSLVGLNLGGFFIGLILGILGGALTLAWAPRRPTRAITDDPTAGGPGHPADAPEQDTAITSRASTDDAATAILPAFTESEGEQQAPPSPRGSHRKMFVIALVPTAMTAAVMVAGSHLPASAEECPDGLPSRSTSAAASSTPARAAASRSAAAKAVPKTTAASTAAKAANAAGKTGATAKESTTPSSSAPASADDEESDHPVVDGIKDAAGAVVNGVGDLLGLGEEEKAADPAPSTSESSAPAPEPAPADTPTKDPAPAETPSAPADSKPAADPPAGEPSTAKTPTADPTPTNTPKPSTSDVPCLGPRVFKQASPDDLPGVSLKGGTLEGDSLTMYNSSYDGVTTVTTADGPVKVLKFSMTKSVTKPFELTVPEAGGHTTQISSSALTTEGNVRFYTPKFTGKLFGVIPVTFTPDSPPPLTLPVLWFTDVKIQLSYVRCDTLTADPIKLIEKA
ncbi:hypothetical protein EV385_6577 [Krasilnikovia cinnamomea]|uniref:Uncharacterized protein n=1 Tax=Krasilnikovia cinnamomea TaxID=349313 RepID=A0A4V2G804_9ACTN|nr:DUF6114 domain-containing protein [Krasilnikovia cinnamomea]RZU54626.1 hypothetical protein EV385_6577 [Krasilnikovia cinnamomea]